MLATIRPGPVLHVWQDGRECAVVPLTRLAALRLASALLAALAEDEAQDRARGPQDARKA
jgi:hypothetical protein